MKVDFGSGHSPKKGFKTCDITGMSYLDYTFDPFNYKIDCPTDFIAELHCRNVLHHIPDLDRLFAEFSSKMVAGGKVVVTEPRQECFKVNTILDVLWYRYVIPRYDIWICDQYRDYVAAASKYFRIVSLVVAEEKEIVTMTRI